MGEHRRTLVCRWALLRFTEVGSPGGRAGGGRNEETRSDVLMSKCFWEALRACSGDLQKPGSEREVRQEEDRWGFNDSGRNWGRIHWREGQKWGEGMVFHVQGGGRSWGLDTTLVPAKRRAGHVSERRKVGYG